MSTASESLALQLRPGWGGRVLVRAADVSHRTIGIRYLLTSAGFFALAGATALVMRLQLATPENTLLGPETYDQAFSMHGITMMFLVAVPVMEGLALAVVPLMLGSRQLAFPRLAAYSYWLYLFGGLTLWIGFLFHKAPNDGWFDYPPLAEPRYTPGIGIDLYATGIALVELATVIAAISLIVTILRHRAPGMSLSRIPIFAWAVLVMGAMIVVAMPALIVACLLLEADRTLGTSFYKAADGGTPLLWQHLFWFFGHPEVYIMLLPGLGIISTVTSTFARRKTVGYPLVVTGLILIGAVSFAVWVHHMYASSMSTAGMTLFSAATLSVVVPSGIIVFSTLATLGHGRAVWRFPLLYVLGYVWTFVLGGLTGVELASEPFDGQAHDSYFLVAHFHYVLLGGVILPLMAGVAFWLPKLAGRVPDDRLGVISFVFVFAGVNLTFFPMHLAGLDGMPRRIYTYPAGLGWGTPQFLATVGGFVMLPGFIAYAASLWRSKPATADPWHGATLEWATASPPPPRNFEHEFVVDDAYPLWKGTPQTVQLTDPIAGEQLTTNIRDAIPEQRTLVAGPSLAPVTAAVATAVAVLGPLLDPILVPLGLISLAIALLAWLLPSSRAVIASEDVGDGRLPSSLDAAEHGLRAPIVDGVLLLIAAAGFAFLALVSAYVVLSVHAPTWPAGGIDPRSPWLGIVAAVIAVAGAAAPIRARASDGHLLLVAGSALCLLVAATLLAIDDARLDYNWATNATGAIEWALTAFAILALLSAAAVAIASAIATSARTPGAIARRVPLQVSALIGSFAAIVTLATVVFVDGGARI